VGNGVNVSTFFGVGAGVLRPEAGGESRNCDSARLWCRLNHVLNRSHSRQIDLRHQCLYQRWSRSRSAGVDSGRNLHFRLKQEPESIF